MKKILVYLLLSATALGYFIGTDINKTNILERKPVDRTYVQILSSESADVLQSLVNNFIVDKEIIDIQFQTQLGQRLVIPFYSVLIIYKY